MGLGEDWKQQGAGCPLEGTEYFFLTVSVFYTECSFGHSVSELSLRPRLWFHAVCYLNNSTLCHSYILKIEPAISFEMMVPVCHCMIVTSQSMVIFATAVGTSAHTFASIFKLHHVKISVFTFLLFAIETCYHAFESCSGHCQKF